MARRALTQPEIHKVNRSQLRQNQSATLRLASGLKVVVISAHHQEDEKLLVDRTYFETLLQRLRSVMATLEITSDPKLFRQILNSAENLEENTRLGKLHSFEEAFQED